MNEFGEEEKNVPYDLREIYAKLVGQHMDDVVLQTKLQNYPRWLRALEDLHTITKFKFDNPEEDNKEYQRLKKIVIELANKYSGTWTTNTKNPGEVAEIEKALRELEDCLFTKMQEGGIFGRGYEYDDDEI